MEPPEVRITIDNVSLDDLDREVEDSKERRKSKLSYSNDPRPMATAPAHIHGNEWKDMIGMSKLLSESPTYDNPSSNHGRTRSNTKTSYWIEQTIQKRECNLFVPSQKYLNKCGCGRSETDHDRHVRRATVDDASIPRVRWSIKKHTSPMPTDAYGTIHFENVGVQSEARFARLSFDSSPSTVLRLLQNGWRMKTPKLIITIHGGLTNFELQTKLARALRRGLIKTAKSCDTWIITTGLHQGAVQHVCDALTDIRSSRKTKSKCAAIGIAPWGLVKKRSRLIGKDITAKYTMNVLSQGRFLELDNSHSHFLFADNGTVGRYGSEVILRRRLESFLATGPAPVVAVVIEGGCFAVKVVHDYLTSSPSIPVVVCDGSGRASDILAFTQQCLQDEDDLPPLMHSKLLSLIKSTFDMDELQYARMMRQIVESAKRKQLLNIFRLGEGMDDVDHAIFSALIKGTNMDQLRLALAWNRVDIARSHIFGGNLIWNQSEMQEALMYSLLHNRVDFVHLILENGVSITNFLTFERLEQLYNSDLGPVNTLRSITKSERFTLPMIGAVVEKLIGRSYRSQYTSDEFKQKYAVYENRLQFKAMSAKRSVQRENEMPNGNGHTINRKKTTHMGHFEEDEEEDDRTTTESLFAFERPFNELLIWAVLTKRQDMALVMWKHGEEALAKSLIASRLYTSLSNIASDEFLEMTLCDELRENAEQFQELGHEFLDACFKVDDELTSSLLTYELTNWGNLTAMSIASNNHDRCFMKHPSCQTILNEIWHGGMVVKHKADWMIIASIFIPPLLFTLDYKSKEELRQQPQTSAEFEEGIEDDDESSDSDSESSLSSDEDSTTSEDEKAVARRNSRSSSVNFSNLLATARRSFRKSEEPENKQTIQQLAANTLPGMFPGAPLPSTGAQAITDDQSKVKAGATQYQPRNRKESNSETAAARYNRKISRSSTLKSSRRATKDTWSGIFDLEEEREEAPLRKKTPLNWIQKIYEFYTAPITTFHMWELGFALFQITLAYCILVRTDPERIHWEEFYLIAYVVVLGCDLMRKFFYYDVHPFSTKLYKFFYAFRNGTSVIAVVTYCIGFGFRCVPGWEMFGRVIIIMNSVLWSLKFVEYLSVYRLIGPYIKISSEMIPTCLPQLILLAVIMLSYGTVRQSMTYPDEDWNVILIRNIFLKPYYMLYGEVYAAQIDTCNEGMWDYHLEQGIPMYAINDTSDPEWNCVPGHWVSPLYMTFFMIISFVLFMNSMIASCTWVYEHRVMYTKEIWLLERFRVVMDYEARPFLPPPFSFIVHLYTLIKYFIWKCTCTKKNRKFVDNTLKRFLTPDQLHALNRFECQVLDNLERKKEFDNKHTEEEHVIQSCNRTETILNQLNSMSNVKDSVKELVRDLDERMRKLENGRKDFTDLLTTISSQLEELTSNRSSSAAPPSYEEYMTTPVPRVFVRTGSSDSLGQEVMFGEDERSTTSRTTRRHNEYSTIADAIDQRSTTQRATFPHTRRRRVSSSGEPNPNLFSVSEADELQEKSD